MSTAANEPAERRHRPVARGHRTIIGLTSIVQVYAKRVRRADRLDLAREMIAHSDELEARAERQTDEVATARLEGQVQGWREAAARLRTRRT